MENQIKPTRNKMVIVHPLICGVFLTVVSLGNVNVLAALPEKLPENTLPRVLGVEIVSARGGQAPELVETGPKSIAPVDIHDISATSFVVYDEKTGKFLIENNADLEVPIASLTKLVTGFVAYKYLDMNTPVTVGYLGKNAVNPVLHLSAGDEVKPLDLVESMLVGSANDAALVIAKATEELTGKGFAQLMNEEAHKLGMTNSHFSNALGFDSLHNYSTAEDLVKLIQATQILPIFTFEHKSKSYSFTNTAGRSYRIQATNKLLGTHKDIFAIKTGYTAEAAGAMAVKVENNGNPFVILVLRSQNREGDVLALKSAVEKSFSWE